MKARADSLILAASSLERVSERKPAPQAPDAVVRTYSKRWSKRVRVNGVLMERVRQRMELSSLETERGARSGQAERDAHAWLGIREHAGGNLVFGEAAHQITRALFVRQQFDADGSKHADDLVIRVLRLHQTRGWRSADEV